MTRIIQIIQNAIFVPEKDLFLKSAHRHDYVTVKLDDGKVYSIDGGDEYFKVSGDLSLIQAHRIIPCRLTSESSFIHEIVPMLLWGTRGINGKSPLKHRPMHSFTSDHLKAILANCPNASSWHKLVAHHLLVTRGDV